MDLTMMQKKKHLLLLNKIMRAELKKDIIPVPSKLTEEEVNKYFDRLFVKKEDYYVPIKSKVELNIDEEQFKDLIKKKKTTKEKKKEKEVQSEKDKEMQESITLSVYKKFEKDFVEPYVTKKRANEDFKKEEKAMIDKYIKIGVNVKELISKKLPNIWKTLLNPAYLKSVEGKEVLKEEDKKIMKEETIKETKIDLKQLFGEFKKYFNYKDTVINKNIMKLYKQLNKLEKDAIFKTLSEYYEHIKNNMIKELKETIKNYNDTYEIEKNIKMLENSIQYNKSFKTKKALESGAIKNEDLNKKLKILIDDKERIEKKKKVYTEYLNILNDINIKTESDLDKIANIGSKIVGLHFGY